MAAAVEPSTIETAVAAVESAVTGIDARVATGVVAQMRRVAG